MVSLVSFIVILLFKIVIGVFGGLFYCFRVTMLLITMAYFGDFVVHWFRVTRALIVEI